jgi:DNA polymerase I-like protein with 3'-5' exonuclease and polymerase domains
MATDHFEQFLKVEPPKKKGKKARDDRQDSLLLGGSSHSQRSDGIGFMATSMVNRALGEYKSTWKPPEFPDLTDSEIISLDIESDDPKLHSRGPGFIRKEAQIIGVGVMARSRAGQTFKGYYPVRHRAGTNFDIDVVSRWLSDNMRTEVPKVGANLLYDLEGLLLDFGVKVQGPIFDIQNAEGILDEESARVTDESHRGFALDKLGLKYFGHGKLHETLERIGAALGITKKNKKTGFIDVQLGRVKGMLKDLPPELVGDYGEGDCELALQVFDEQKKLIEKEGLENIWKLECDLVPMLLDMRVHGVRVDLDRAEQAEKALKAEHKAMLERLRDAAGFALDPWSNPELTKYCDQKGIKYLLTDAGNPSFTAKWLYDQKDPALKLTLGARRLEKMNRDFIRSAILDEHINGRIHAQFHQLKKSSDEGDEEGTRSGRFSSTNPNLQQVPKRDERFAAIIRACFLPDEGKMWTSADYASQEFRLLAHVAANCAKLKRLGPDATRAALELMEEYRRDPKLDYHQRVALMTSLPRKIAKPLNLMLVYGAGKKKVAVSTGWITEAQYRDKQFELPQEVHEFFEKYHKGVPFVKELLEEASNMASTRGYVITILGRHRHFDLWAPKRKEDGYSKDGEPFIIAKQIWGDVPMMRAGARKALNGVIQGSAADMTKVAMLSLWREGIRPQLPVHDEINASTGSVEESWKIYEHMTQAVKLLVPIGVDMGVGTNWSSANHNDFFDSVTPIHEASYLLAQEMTCGL